MLCQFYDYGLFRMVKVSEDLGLYAQTHRLYDSIDFKSGKPMDVLFMAKKKLMSKEDGRWMDGFWLEVLTDSISVISS